ncbi:hypothetical protein SpCBS45565_g04650 [Spizellomyces sp. 'palustris']|nr:hypothetical protein SpCBS45565_g04650 [Spizellomyces sp. 'palustris']
MEVQPRVNSAVIPKCQGRVVRLVGKMLGMNPATGEALIEACDRGQVTVLVSQGSPLAQSTGSVVEVIGRVQQNSVIGEINSTQFDDKWDPDAYNKMVLASMEFDHIFGCLVIGALNGSFKQALVKIDGINAKHGPFDLLLCVGDFFGADETDNAAVQELLKGDISEVEKVPVPTYIIAGRHTLPNPVLEAVENNGGKICNNLDFLGNSGVMTTVQGLKIAYLSGTYDAKSYPSGDDQTPDQTAMHYTETTVRSLSTSGAGSVHGSTGVDIFITTEWAEWIIQGSVAASKLPEGTDPRSSKPVADLAVALQPRYHFAGSAGVFFEREPYSNRGAAGHVTRFIGLGEYGAANKQRWFYAMNIVPLSQMESSQLNVKPPNTTTCPLPFGSTSKKRALDEVPDSFFFNNAGARGQKRQANGRPPPRKYICHRCQKPGHWLEDCPINPKELTRTPPEKYVCRLCNVPGHYINDCPHADRNLRGPKATDTILNRDAGQCWFCLSNPALEKQLIVSIGSEVYLTLAKGGLVDWGGHMLVVPIAHYTSMRQMQTLDGAEGATAQAALAEMEKFKSALRDMYTARGDIMVCFEIFGGGGNADVMRMQHMHLQLVPLPADLLPDLEKIFLDEAAEEGLEVVQDGRLPDAVTAPYCRVEIPAAEQTRVLVFRPSAAKVEEVRRLTLEAAQGGRRPPRVMNLQFGRKVLSTLLGKPDRINWKNCILPETEEQRLTEEMRRLVKLG